MPGKQDLSLLPERITLVSGAGEDADLLRVPTDEAPKLRGELTSEWVRVDLVEKLEADLARCRTELAEACRAAATIVRRL